MLQTKKILLYIIGDNVLQNIYSNFDQDRKKQKSYHYYKIPIQLYIRMQSEKEYSKFAEKKLKYNYIYDNLNYQNWELELMVVKFGTIK